MKKINSGEEDQLRRRRSIQGKKIWLGEADKFEIIRQIYEKEPATLSPERKE
ncbi:MAG: hypothetical protein E7L01_26195 [Paenibacillus macerans]|uniref:Uncharacterized protein n=1 Tax=Paenibacillus macerans TaxID=44252 RepID=A0A6N8F7C5_PAEMA|nr:hypothetical protein [Paenibacillus macerans]MBS5910922.1 hypothetical protein [Paenibacillus macerans]MCY7562104.1 hypothetical protein [Paenibacillus macerans]MDU5950111.1 hypothetical protein [Paenibacillus macerans]MDU7476806.1 hypothetical protein [Paenibacillus macerans]MEC0141106.1 hypothetical protein [Paenibacillus macerans]